MITLVLAIVLSSDVTPEFLRAPRVRGGAATGLRAGGRAGNFDPLFEFAPTSGAGMTAECACTTPSAATGQTMIFTRASSAFCTKGPLDKGIDVGDMIQCASNEPLITAGDDGGIPGHLVENAGTNNCLRSQELNNASWTSVATVTADSILAPDNTLTAETLSDASAAAVQGSTQVIASTAALHHAFGCYVRAGTATSATVSMTGTGSATGNCSATVTGLDPNRWTRLQCGSSAAYAGTLTAVSVFVGVGSVVADTGTIYVWGCQHESNTSSTQPYLTSYIPTTTAAATRIASSVSWSGVLSTPINSSVVSQGSTSATYILQGSPTKVGGTFSYIGGAGRLLYWASGLLGCYDGANVGGRASGATAFIARRAASSWSGSTMTVFDVTGGLSTSSAFDGAMGNDGVFMTGYSPATLALGGVIKQVCLSSNPSTCR